MKTPAVPITAGSSKHGPVYWSTYVPFFVRHPWVGFLLFFTGTAAFALLSWLVVRQSPLLAFDLPWAQSIHQWAKGQSLPVELFMRGLSLYGRDGVAFIVLFMTIAWVRRKAWREVALLLLGVGGGEFWFQVLSGALHRARPEFKDPFETLIGYGYPSGHAATNLLLGWLVLYLLLPRMRTRWSRFALTITVTAVVLLIGFSRLYLGLHYPTDMLAGYLLGLAWGGLIYTVIDLFFWRARPAREP